MEEPLIERKRERTGHARFVWCKGLFALVQVGPGVGLTLYLSFGRDVDTHCVVWYTLCAALLIVAGLVELIAVVLMMLKTRAAYIWQGMGSQWVGCIIPVPLLILIVVGTSLPIETVRDQRIVLGYMVLAGYVAMVNVLCVWKRACLLCVACLRVCDSQHGPATS